MLIDAHAHLDKYGANLSGALEQIRTHKILTISASMDEPSYQIARKISESSSLIIPTFGIHPWEAPKYADNLDAIDPYLNATPLIGECGLDFHFVKDKMQYPLQRVVFEHQLAFARDVQKPVVIHAKGAEDAVLATLQTIRVSKAVIHWYTGPPRLIDSFLSLGCHFTIGVDLLYSSKIQELARIIPMDRILLETDNPGGWQWLAHETGMPVRLLDVIDRLAIVRNCDRSVIERQVTQNFMQLTHGIVSIDRLLGA
jgi:TatD DNase family protein